MGPKVMFGFMGRCGGIPTNVGSGGGVQPPATLCSDMTLREAVDLINEANLEMQYNDLFQVIEMQKKMAVEHNFTAGLFTIFHCCPVNFI
jgi:hypothetical protein